ncbi:hypothetical protein HY837_06900 [archaeon]|nr:hypothetical protein [archaeon]
MKKRGSELGFRYSGRQAIIGFSLIYLLLTLYSYTKSGYLSSFNLSIPIIVIAVTGVFYFVSDAYFQKTSNRVLIYLRDLNSFDVTGILLASYSLIFLYQLIFNFYNVEVSRLYFFFISLFITVVIGTIIFLFSLLKYKKGEGVLNLFKKNVLLLDPVYRFGISDYIKPTYKIEYKRPKVIKIINSVGYILFILYLLLVGFTANYRVETEGVFEKLNYEYVTTTGHRGASPSIAKLIIMEIYTKDKKIVDFVIGAKAVKDFENNYQCLNLQPGYIVKIRHHPFAYSWPYFNEVVSCRI